MKFTATKSDLLTAIARCVPVTDAKGTMPILSTVHLDCGVDTLQISATDLFRSIRTTIAVNSDDAGSICLSGKDLLERIRSMPDGKIAFSTEGTKATIKAVGSARKFTMLGVPGDEFPTMPEQKDPGPALKFKPGVLLDLIAKTQFSVSTDMTRIHLNSLYIEADPSGAVRFVSTDGHRLSHATHGGEPGDSKFVWLVPLNAVNDLRKLLDSTDADVTINRDGSSLFLNFPEFQFTTKLTDAQFPPFQQVIPDKTTRQVETDRRKLADALRAVSVSANSRTGGVTFTFKKNALRIECESADKGEAFDELETDYSGEEIRIGFNARYMLDVLGAIGEDMVSIETSAELDPAIVRGAGNTSYLGVVMPMRVT